MRIKQKITLDPLAKYMVSVPTCLSRIGILAALCLLLACGQNTPTASKEKAPQNNPPVPVAVATVARKTMTVCLRTIGTVTASASVHIKSQVEGELTGVHFKEGAEVSAGDLLFSIDNRPYAAQLKQAEASLAKDLAQLENARKQRVRYAGLVGKGGVAQEQYDTALTSVLTLEATLRADEAAVDSARLKVDHCTLRAPMDGVTGTLKIDRGNLVKANDTENPLVTILQIRPIQVLFSVPEKHLAEVRRRMAQNRLEVQAVIPGEEGAPERGELSFIENTVDAATGTISLRARFNNRQNRLWPGQFVNVSLNLSTLTDAIVVPAQAVQTGQQGPYLFVVKEDQTVALQPVTVDRTLDGEAVIASGVSPGQIVVIDGHLRLTPGAAVTVANGEERESEGPSGVEGTPP